VTIGFGVSPGEVDVSFGHTRVLANCVCEVAAPFPDRPSEGLVLCRVVGFYCSGFLFKLVCAGTLKFNVELSPMASPAFEAGRPSELAVEVARILERTLKDSRVVDLESLCIVPEEKVWSVRVDVHVIDHDGNLVDAAVLAALTSLLHARFVARARIRVEVFTFHF
jgi:exosome complex component RRP45